jgi:PAS domain S-box-containing protein
MRQHLSLIIIGAITGALLLVFFSALQKIMAGYPLKPTGFGVPALFGSISGIIISSLFLRERSALYKLQEQTSILNAILNNVMAGIMLIDPQTKQIKMVNQNAARLLGYSIQELTRSNCAKICPEGAQCCPVLKNNLSVDNARRALRHNEGYLLHTQKSVNKIHIDGDELFLETFLDLSKQIETEKFIEDIFNSIQYQLAVIAENGVIIAVNQTWKDFSEENNTCPENSWGVGANYFEISPFCEAKNSSEKIVAGLQDVAKGATLLFEMEYCCRSHKGIGWFIIRATPLKNKPGHLVIAHIDISKQKQAQIAADDSHRQLEFIIEAARIGTWDVDLTTGFSHYNNQWRHILGYDIAEIEPTFSYWKSLIHPEDLADVENKINRHLNDKNNLYFATFRMRHKTGAWRWVLSQGRVIEYAKAGDPLRIAGIHIDITEKQEIYLALLQFQQAVEQTAEGILITDVHGRIEYINPAFEQLSGYSNPECRGQYPSLFTDKVVEKHIISGIIQTITQGTTWNDRVEMMTKTGKRITLEGSIAPVLDDHGVTINYVMFCHDVTLAIIKEQQWNRAQKLEAIGLMIGRVSHDFNNLLTPIIGLTSLLLRNNNFQESERKCLEEIHNAGNRSQSLVKQLLTFSKGQEMHMERHSPSQVLRDMESLLRLSLPENITLQVKLLEVCDPVLMDKGQLEQILMNLVINARDAISNGGAILISNELTELNAQACAAYSGAKPGKYCAITVTDNGCGMNKTTMERIFDPYFSTKSDKGTGLGLASVYAIISRHHGYITVDSMPGEGTRITIHLPLHTKTT